VRSSLNSFFDIKESFFNTASSLGCL
jgi:hypothetical protein